FSSASPTTVLAPLSLHDALPICAPPWAHGHHIEPRRGRDGERRWPPPAAHEPRQGPLPRDRDDQGGRPRLPRGRRRRHAPPLRPDRKSTRLNSSHVKISYAVFCS